MHCNSLQHTATHCNTLQLPATHCNSLQHTATHCNSLQHTATRCNSLQHTATHCNTLQLPATHCNTLHLPATHCNTTSWQETLSQAAVAGWHSFCFWFTFCFFGADEVLCLSRCWLLRGGGSKVSSHSSLQHTATLCSTLQHTATHSSTLRPTATQCKILQHPCNTWNPEWMQFSIVSSRRNWLCWITTKDARCWHSAASWLMRISCIPQFAYSTDFREWISCKFLTKVIILESHITSWYASQLVRISYKLLRWLSRIHISTEETRKDTKRERKIFSYTWAENIPFSKVGAICELTHENFMHTTALTFEDEYICERFTLNSLSKVRGDMQVVVYMKFQNAFSKVRAIRESTHVTVRHNLRIALTFDNEFNVNFPPKCSFSKVSAVVYMKFSWVNSHIALTFKNELESTHETFSWKSRRLLQMIGLFCKRAL